VRYHLSVFVCIREKKQIMVITGYEQSLRYFEESNPKKTISEGMGDSPQNNDRSLEIMLVKIIRWKLYPKGMV
jgi:hypothetical protein